MIRFRPPRRTATLFAVTFALSFTTLGSCTLQDLLDAFVEQSSRDRTELLEDDGMHVILVGTGGPIANDRRVSQCTAILAGGEFFLVDVGPGSTRRASLLRLPGADLSGILLTHFHSDHIGDLGETNIQSWLDGRTESLEVFGPEGVDEIVDGFNKAYALDVQYRNIHHGEAYMPRDAGVMHSSIIPFDDPDEAVLLFDRNGLRAYAFGVIHDPATPAVGYRFEYRGNVVVVTGDTKETETLADHARGADILISDVLSFDLINRIADSLTRSGLERPAALARDVLDYHMDPSQVGALARQAGAGKLVLVHIVPPVPEPLEVTFLNGARRAFGGEVMLGEDGMSFRLDPKCPHHGFDRDPVD